jgi:hypothetical protein
VNSIDFTKLTMDELLQHFLRLSFDEANMATIKRQLLQELSLRIAAKAQEVMGHPARVETPEQPEAAVPVAPAVPAPPAPIEDAIAGWYAQMAASTPST